MYYGEPARRVWVHWYRYDDSRGEVMKMLSASSSASGSSGGCWRSRSSPSDLLSSHRSTWSPSFCTARTSPRSTSGIYNYSWTPSRLCAPPRPAHTPRTASCSSASPTCSSPCPSSGTRGPLCPASLGCGFPGSSRGSLPGGPAPCERWSWRSRRWPPGWPRCSRLLGADRPSGPCGTSPSGSSPPPWTPAAAASRSEWCSSLTRRDTYRSSAWSPSQPGGTESTGREKIHFIHGFIV